MKMETHYLELNIHPPITTQMTMKVPLYPINPIEIDDYDPDQQYAYGDTPLTSPSTPTPPVATSTGKRKSLIKCRSKGHRKSKGGIREYYIEGKIRGCGRPIGTKI